MEEVIVERITRERLRALKPGQTITAICRDGYDLESQRNTAYTMGKLEGCRFSCSADGLRLTVTRYDDASQAGV